MTRTVARLILAMLLLPLTGAVFLILAVGLIATSPSGPPAIGRLLLLWSILYVFVARTGSCCGANMVTWNRRRRADGPGDRAVAGRRGGGGDGDFGHQPVPGAAADRHDDRRR